MGLFIAAFFVEILIMKRNGASTSSDRKIGKKEKESKNSEKKSDGKKSDGKISGDKILDDKTPDVKKPEVDSREIIIENNMPKTD